MTARKPDLETLRRLEPVGALSEGRLRELAELCELESVSRNLDPFRGRPPVGQTVYLVKGEIALAYSDGTSIVLVGGSEEARGPLGRRGGIFSVAKTITDSELLRVDDDLLDIMATWDQVAAEQAGPAAQTVPTQGPSLARWSIMSGMFSVSNLKYGAFAQLPAANIEALLERFERIEVKAGEVIIREGEPGDYYYVIESGKARVERMVGGVSMLLADLKSGDAFGEEALVSETRRNATVTMKTSGALLRLDKQEFIALLREPLLHRISIDQAQEKVFSGAQWIDVRYPSEYQYDKLSGAINIPLAEIRNAVGLLDKDREYIVYCQSERRSSAAAFLLAQAGYRAYLLRGGLWEATNESRAGGQRRA